MVKPGFTFEYSNKRKSWFYFNGSLFICFTCYFSFKTYLKDMLAAYGPTRFVTLMILGSVMLALPIKMYLRWIFNLQYIIAIPEWFLNI